MKTADASVYLSRIERVREEMTRHQVDALLL